MSDDALTRHDHETRNWLRKDVSRAKFLAASGAGVVAATVPNFASAQSTPTSETVQQIINIADTAEHLAVTLLTAVVKNAGVLGLTTSKYSALFVSFVQAALAQEQYHADFLEANGAKPLTDTFTVPDPKILTDLPTLLHTVEAAETLFVGAYMAAVREFTVLGQPVLAKYAYQIGGVEAEHLAHVRAGMALTGDMSGDPPNNRAFELNPVKTVGDAATQLQQLGFIGGTGTQVTYPGRAAALAAAAPILGSVTDTTPTNSGGTPLAAFPVEPSLPRRRHWFSGPF